MRFAWNVTPINDPAAGKVGVMVTLSIDGVMVQDLIAPNQAREIAEVMAKLADEVAPPPPPPAKRARGAAKK